MLSISKLDCEEEEEEESRVNNSLWILDPSVFIIILAASLFEINADSGISSPVVVVVAIDADKSSDSTVRHDEDTLYFIFTFMNFS